MEKIIEKIQSKIKNRTLDSRDIEELIAYLLVNKKDLPFIADELAKLKIAKFLIPKIMSSEPERSIQITGDEWRAEKLDFNLISLWIDDFEVNDFIAYKTSALGGYISFDVVKRKEIVLYIYNQINEILDQAGLFASNNIKTSDEELPNKGGQKVFEEVFRSLQGDNKILKFLENPFVIFVLALIIGTILFGNYTGVFTQMLQGKPVLTTTTFESDKNTIITSTQLEPDKNIALPVTAQIDNNNSPVVPDSNQVKNDPDTPLKFISFYGGYSQGFVIQNITDLDINARISYILNLNSWNNPGYCSGIFSKIENILIPAQSNKSINIPSGNCSGYVDSESVQYIIYK
ncbi:MAG: hypothetical protein WC462_00055 [archaeon]